MNNYFVKEAEAFAFASFALGIVYGKRADAVRAKGSLVQRELSAKLTEGLCRKMFRI